MSFEFEARPFDARAARFGGGASFAFAFARGAGASTSRTWNSFPSTSTRVTSDVAASPAGSACRSRASGFHVAANDSSVAVP